MDVLSATTQPCHKVQKGEILYFLYMPSRSATNLMTIMHLHHFPCENMHIQCEEDKGFYLIVVEM